MSNDDEINVDIPEDIANLLERVSDKPKQKPEPKEIVEPVVEPKESKKLKHDETSRDEAVTEEVLEDKRVLDAEIVDVSGNIKKNQEVNLVATDIRTAEDNKLENFSTENKEEQVDEFDEQLSQQIYDSFSEIMKDCDLDREEAQHAINGLRQEFEDNTSRRDIVVEGYISAIQTKATALNTKVRAAELLVKLKKSRKSNINIKDSNVLVPEDALHKILNKKKKR